FSLSLDAWTSSNGYAFIAMVLHWVDNKGELQKSVSLTLPSWSVITRARPSLQPFGKPSVSTICSQSSRIPTQSTGSSPQKSFLGRVRASQTSLNP
ncbi:hypothetical protein B0H10DRAFT_2123978, partial [Mycena sp. CBHHK59/15]